MNKETIFDAAIQKQNGIIADFKKRVDEMEAASFVDDSEPVSQVEKTGSSTVEVMNVLEKELVFAEEELQILNELKKKSESWNEARVGAVVKTDKRNFFIGVSVEEFKAANEIYFGISAAAPIYHAMAGKKAGESFTFANIQYSISSIA